MFYSVKHVTGKGENRVEALYTGKQVRFTPGDDYDFAPLEIRSDGVLIAGLWGGTAYVMNETGKTIDVYKLRSQPEAKAVA